MIPNNVQEDVADEVNERLARATRELQEKYARGEGGKDVSVDGPTGTAYKEKHQKEIDAKKRAKAAKQASSSEDRKNRQTLAIDESEDEDDDDADPELRRIREQRLRQLKAQKLEMLENMGKGHGQYREVTQDEFLAEVTSSTKVVCHFYHKDFPRCEIMNMHINKLVQRHVETKFIRINAEKAPFFVEKVSIAYRVVCSNIRVMM